MIKDFKQFSKDFQNAISNIDRKQTEINREKRDVETKYKKEMCDIIDKILDELRERYDFDDLINYLEQKKTKGDEKLLNEIRYISFEFYGGYYTMGTITHNDEDYELLMYEDEDNYREFAFIEMDIMPLYEFFKGLLNYYSTITNSEVFKKLNEMSNNIASHLDK